MRGSNRQLCMPSRVLPSAYLVPEGLNCCCYQLSIHLQIDYTILWDKFRELHAARYSDTFDYVSPAMLIQYAEESDRPAYFLKTIN